MSPSGDTKAAPPTQPANTLRSRVFDVLFTATILGYGTFNMVDIARNTQQIDVVLQTFYTSLNLGDYTPGSMLEVWQAVALWSQLLLWTATVLVCLYRIANRKRAILVPVIAGAISMLVLFVEILFLLLNDPQFVSGFAA